jgi:glycosyltransferase involved in cell wall biosynthesis
MTAASRPRLLVLCPDPVGEVMSGLGIRFTELARVLGDHADVRLATTELRGAPPEGLSVVRWDADGLVALRELAGWADLALLPPLPPHVLRTLRRAGVRLAVDLYDPESLEVLERFRGRGMTERRLHARMAADKLLDALRHGSFFICASERQRDLWIGAMLAAGLLTPAVYERDATLRSVLDVVPFGLPGSPPVATGTGGARRRFPGIGADERIVLWNGGLWGWLDAPAAIRALAVVRSQGIAARLVMMGASAEGGAGAAVAEARAEAERLRLGDAVLFNDRWVPYAERADWLLEADCAISTHRDHLETRFAFRTRLLDCLWAGLPVVCTGGDALADLVADQDLGATARPGDDEAIAAGLARVLAKGRGHYEARLRTAAAGFTWQRVAEPLARHVAEPAARRLGAAGLAPLELAPAQQARRLGQRITRRVRALRSRAN